MFLSFCARCQSPQRPNFMDAGATQSVLKNFLM
jgi:hypothetical protein